MPTPAPKPAYAPFGRRCLALVIDAALLVLVVVAIVEASDRVGLRVFEPLWRPPKMIGFTHDQASRLEDVLEDGRKRVFDRFNEARVFADGSMRIYAVSEIAITDDKGAVEKFRAERLVATDRASFWRRVGLGVLTFVLAFIYFAATEASRRQGSLGKYWLGLQVVALDGTRLGVWRSLLRQLCKCLEVVSSFLTYLIALFTEKRQGLHDIMAGTLVIKRPASA
ncbi:MAG: RDD family protein [Alphaproteobacteria bacterium]